MCLNLLHVRGNAATPNRLRLPGGRPAVIGVVLAIVLIALLSFFAVQLTRHRQSAPPQSNAQLLPTQYAIPGCYNPSVQPVERPKKLDVFGCASVAVALQDMSWNSWGQQGSDGTGTAVFQTCDPNCATGSHITNPVIVHAWNPQPPRQEAICQTGLEIFADLILAFPDSVPPPTAQKMTTQFNGMPAVHYVNYAVGNGRDTQFIGYTYCN